MILVGVGEVLRVEAVEEVASAVAAVRLPVYQTLNAMMEELSLCLTPNHLHYSTTLLQSSVSSSSSHVYYSLSRPCRMIFVAEEEASDLEVTNPRYPI